MEFVPAQLISDEQCYEDKSCQSEGKPEYVDKGERPIPEKISGSNLENVFEHNHAVKWIFL